MTVIFKLLADGAFLVGDTESGRTYYAAPTTLNAAKARGENLKYGVCTPAQIAKNMAKALRPGHPGCPRYDAECVKQHWDLLKECC